MRGPQQTDPLPIACAVDSQPISNQESPDG